MGLLPPKKMISGPKTLSLGKTVCMERHMYAWKDIQSSTYTIHESILRDTCREFTLEMREANRAAAGPQRSKHLC